MADPIDAILRQFEAQSVGKPTARAGKPDPQIDAVLRDLEAQAQRSTPPAPPPVQVPMPQGPPTAYHQNPHVTLGPHGRAVDPSTGQEFPQRGHPVENAPAPAYASAAEVAGNVGEALAPVEHFTTPHITMPALRVLAVLANPVQQTAAEAAKGYHKGGAAGIIPGIVEGGGRIAHSLVQPEIARSDIGTNLGIENPYERAAIDFAGNLGIDWATGKFIQAPLVGGLIKGTKSALQVSGAADVPLPVINKSLNTLAAEGKDVRGIHQYFGATAGRWGEIRREGEQYLQRAQQRVNGLKKAGVNIQGVGQGSGQPVNAVDELVSHYIEAGSGPRAAFSSQADVLAAGDRLARTPEQAALIRQYITETAQDYTTAWQRIGNELERVGYLKPGAVAKMKGQYVPGMYHATSHNPADIETWLDTASQLGAVNPKMVGMAEKLLANERRGFSNASKARTLNTWAERVEHGGEFQASPLFAKSIRSQTGIGSRIEAMQNIATDPELVASTYARGKLQLTGPEYGPAAGLYVQPRTKAAIDALLKPETFNTGAVGQLYRWWKNSVVAGSLPMIQHHSKYVLAMAEGRAAQEGVSFTPKDLADGLRERHLYVTGQGASPAVEALSKNTRAFVPQAELTNELSGGLRQGLGIKSTTGQTLGRSTEKLANQTRKAIGTVEQAVKVALTKKLMLKYTPEEAARIAQETISGTGPPGKALTAIERLGIVPFVTSKARGLPKMAQIAATRPDIMLRYSGLNESRALGTAMGPETRARQQIEEQRTGMPSIPVPGMTHDGRQVVLPQSPFALSPLGGLPEAVGLGLGGPLGRAREAYQNVRASPTKGGQPIVEPGSVPPWEDLLRRVQYVWHGGTVGGAVSRIGMAARGETPYGGPTQEPQTLGEALLQTAFGVRPEVPETPDETAIRATRNLAATAPDQRFALQYLGQLERGEVKINRSPWIDRVNSPFEAVRNMKAAYKRLGELVTGKEGGFAGHDRQQRIKAQVDWFYTLEQRFLELAKRPMMLKDLIEASQ